MGKSGRREDDYKFLPLKDAMTAINQRVNLFAVVVESTLPKLSKGTDYFCTLKIVDKSHHSLGITVNVFSTNMENLPNVESLGDIIQLSQVVMKIHGSEVYALFNKRFSSFALYEGKLGTSFVPYQASSNLLARDEDQKFIDGLRKWSMKHKLDTGPDNTLPMYDLRDGELRNLVCKVLHICEVSKDERMLFVWDGTDAPSVPLHMNEVVHLCIATHSEQLKDGVIPLQVLYLLKDSRSIRVLFVSVPLERYLSVRLEDEMINPVPLRLEQFTLSRDVLREFPAVGTVLRVVAGEANEMLGLHLLKTGRWVKFINIKCEVNSGLWLGKMMPFSKLRYLPDDESIVLKCKRTYDNRLESKLGRAPYFCFPWPSHVTETDYEDVPFVTLMDISSYPKVTAKYKCVVRILTMFPWRAEDFRSPGGTYRIRLTLEDPTARIHAFLYAEDAENFFGGYLSAERMTTQINMLLGVSNTNRDEDVPRRPPWVQVCIKSYYVDKNDVWGSRNYRIFGTRVMG